MKIATWNVNSIRAREARVRAWIERHAPDVLCVQETKVEDAKFPHEAFAGLGYHIEIFGQKTYNGVAVFSKLKPEGIVRGFPGDAADAHKRLIACEVAGIQIVNVYVPNGESVVSEKFNFKLGWLAQLEQFMKDGFDYEKPLLLCGDFNIAPEDRDVHDPQAWRGKVLFHPLEHAALAKIKERGLHDALRLRTADGGLFSWWDYRMGAFHRNMGLRIDLILINEPLVGRCTEVWIDREERKGEAPSDHAPVIAEFK